MPDKAVKITGIYERKLLRKLLQTDQQIKAIYNDYSVAVSDILSKYRTRKNGVVIRDPDLDKQLAGETTVLSNKLKTQIEENQLWAFATANDKTDEILSGFIGSLPTSVIAGKGLFERNEEAFLAFQNRKIEGLKLSDRIWKQSENSRKQIESYLENGLSSGKSAADIAQDVKELLNHPDKLFRRVRDENGNLKLSQAAKAYEPGKGVYRSAVQNARRLARTEINMAYRSADQQRWKGLDFVLGYEVVLSDQHPVPDICDEAAGQYPKNFVFVGWHPNCMCYTIPILPSDEDFMDNLVDGKELSGRVNDVPEGFKNWVEANQDKISGWKSQPFFIRDNFRGGRIEGGLSL